MVEKSVVIKNSAGLHARPATLFVQTANKFPCDIKIKKGEKEVSAKGIMGLLSLAAGQGSEITIRAEGEQAHEAVAALVELVESGFGEN